ncbi:MAG: polyprenyl synthetase family protein [Candidatus Pacebacteria bacterium]|nr:polyprenyl synthetase family protein [Candidatus Paceibacterota bacterium]
MASGRASISLDSLQQLLTSEMQAVNQIIIERMQSEVALIPQLAGHLVASGGKRLRPMITLAAARLCGYQGHRHHRLAAAVEFIHTATLLHDDVVDDSALRRGLPSANELFGNKASVLVGDFLFSRAFALMVEDQSLRVLEILSRASAVIAEGEVLQLMTSNNIATTEDSYMQVIGCKTAVLFEAAAQIGAVVAARPAADELALQEFGHTLGLAFQLIDDALDYTAEQGALGKTVGDDFREGKITMPVIIAIAAASKEERVFWQRTIEEQNQTSDDFATAVELIARHRGVELTLQRAAEFGHRARSALMGFDDSPARRALIEAVEFTIERGY